MTPEQEKFHAHLDECDRCADAPFDLCPKGDRLLTEAACAIGVDPSEARFKAQNAVRRTD